MREDDAALRDRRYWHEKLAAPRSVLNLRTDFRRPVEKTYHGASLVSNLGPAITGALTALCQRHDTTVFTALTAAVKALLFRYTGRPISSSAPRSKAEPIATSSGKSVSS